MYAKCWSEKLMGRDIFEDPDIVGHIISKCVNYENDYESKQEDATIQVNLLLFSAVHVLGDVFAHHQELLTVFTVSGIIHPSCCRLVSWMS